jgi:hypothetical protein
MQNMNAVDDCVQDLVAFCISLRNSKLPAGKIERMLLETFRLCSIISQLERRNPLGNAVFYLKFFSKRTL